MKEIKSEMLSPSLISAMLEAEQIAKDQSIRGYDDVEEALNELKQ